MVPTVTRYLRYSYAEKHRLTEDKRELEERNEQLKAEKERLQYDVHRRGPPLDDDNRSAIRRGLQAGRQPCDPLDDASAADPSEAGERPPSVSPPPSFPPGAPSSTDRSSNAGDSAPGALCYDVQEAAYSLVRLHSATAGPQVNDAGAGAIRPRVRRFWGVRGGGEMKSAGGLVPLQSYDEIS